MEVLSLPAVARLLIVLAAVSLDAVTGAPSVAAQGGSGEIAGDLPPGGGVALIVWGGGTAAQLRSAAESEGCSPASVWATEDGRLLGYIYGAPDFVKAAFSARFPGSQIPVAAPLILVCRASGVPPQVQAVIDLVIDSRLDDLERAVSLSTLPCGPQQGGGSPPACPPGVPAGTPVEVFPVVTCESELRPAAAVRPTLAEMLPTIVRLTGVYLAPPASLHYLPLPQVPGDYVAVFSRQLPGQGLLGVGVVIEGPSVVGLVFGCGAGPSQIVPPGTQPVFLPGG